MKHFLGLPATYLSAWVCLVIALHLEHSNALGADAPRLDSATLKVVKKATVHIRTTSSDGEKNSEGSGFLGVEQNIVLTNAHVINMLRVDSDYPDKVEVTVDSGEPSEKVQSAKILAVDVATDLAILRIEGADLPRPLKVVSATSLEETQGLYVLGFPFGRGLGKNITVSTTTVSSLRKDDNGILKQIQVNGGMHPGNSGGPVVNEKGEVVGIAVAGIRNTQINFAIPGDDALSILHGRLASVRLGPAKQEGKLLNVAVTLRFIDPLHRIKSVSLDYWQGATGKSRPPATVLPKQVSGDDARQTISLAYSKGVAKGVWAIPSAADGKVYWTQPKFANGAGEARWAEATVFRPAARVEEAKADNSNPEKKVPEKGTVQKGLKELEGNWKLVRREVKGDIVHEIENLKIGVVIEDGKMTWTKGRKPSTMQASIEINPLETPRTVDVEFVEGAYQGKKRLGIYELTGKKLKICWNEVVEQKKRPKKFTTLLAIGSGAVLETYERIDE